MAEAKASTAMAITVLLVLSSYARTVAAIKVLKGDAGEERQALQTVPMHYAARAGCPEHGSCDGWFSKGCGKGTPSNCANSEVLSPFSLALNSTKTLLPKDGVDTHRWYVSECCVGPSPHTCSDVWVVFDLGVSDASVGSLRFLNLQDAWGVKKARISVSSSVTGPWGPAQVFDNIPSNGEGNQGRTTNHLQSIPDTLLTLNPGLHGQYVKFEILENHDSTGTGFYRAYFYPIPEPDLTEPIEEPSGYREEDARRSSSVWPPAGWLRSD